ncbi:MAG: alanine racemase [Tepidisphaeraceae bacterium]|jgi:alanine racemase
MEAPSALHPRVVVSRSALLHNVRILRRHLDPLTQICAVVKADAYGHSATIVADALTNFTSGRLEAPAVDALAVATIEEALALTPSVVPIQILRPVEHTHAGLHRHELEAAIRAGHTLTLVSVHAVADVARIATSLGRCTPVQIMLDTGICREGCAEQHLPRVVAAILDQPSLHLAALATHFTSSEDPASPHTLEQIHRFRRNTDPLAAAHPDILRHAANSGAVFFHPAAHFDMVRPGLAVLGLDPTLRPSVDRPLRPALKWTAPLINIRDIPTGQSVGYNQTFIAPRDMRVGLVPVGYADGYCRAFSNRATMIVHSRPAPVLGRVSMDYTTIDLSHIPESLPGDEVTVLDSDPLSPASAYRLAEIADTIPYELFTWIGSRVKRLAVDPVDQTVAESTVRAA